jgi:hypothetical protein
MGGDQGSGERNTIAGRTKKFFLLRCIYKESVEEEKRRTVRYTPEGNGFPRSTIPIRGRITVTQAAEKKPGKAVHWLAVRECRASEIALRNDPRKGQLPLEKRKDKEKTS